MTTTRPEPPIWTLAYRKRTGPWFQRIDLELTWAQAHYAAQGMAQLHPELVVWYTTTKANDDRELAAWAAVGFAPDTTEANYAADVYNIMVDGGKRVAVKDTGKLDPRLCILPRRIAREMYR